MGSIREEHLGPSINIGDIYIGDAFRTYIIAELGINHNGNVGICMRMMSAAKDAGADAAKIQIRTPMACVPKDQWEKPKETPWGDMSYIDYKMKMEFSSIDFDSLLQHSYKIGLPLYASVWDVGALDRYMKMFEPDMVKVPSAALTDHELLQKINQYQELHNLAVILSTGMSDEAEIARAVLTYPWKNLGILHCTSIYPCPSSALNLKAIQFLGEQYPQHVIGYSNHSPGIVHCATAVALGANIVEAHLTLDRTMWGSDQASSFEPGGFAKMVKYVRETEYALGHKRIQIYQGELNAREKLRRVK